MPLPEKRRRGKGKVIAAVLLSILALIVLAAGALAWRFRDEIKAYRISRQYSSQELEDQLAENDRAIQDVAKDSAGITVRVPTDEEREALRDGSMTREELVERLTEKPGAQTGGAGAEHEGGQNQAAGSPTPDKTAKPESTAPTKTSEETGNAEKQKKYESELSALIAKVYVLREEYIAALDDMEAAAKADYRALPSAQRTGTAMASLVSSYLAKATELEKQCDDRMDAIVAELRTLISENKGDMSLLDTVVYSYANEKSLRKAWYMSKLEEKGLI